METAAASNEVLSTGIWALVLAVTLFVLSNLILLGLVVALPADFFHHARSSNTIQRRHWVVYVAAMIAKNLLGLLLLLLGGFLILPGVPGPGLVCILIGLAMVNFPGKRRLQEKLLSYPHVRRTVNRLRARFGRPPLQLEREPVAPDSTEE